MLLSTDVLAASLSNFGDELVADLCQLAVLSRLLFDGSLQRGHPHLGLPEHGLELSHLALTGPLNGCEPFVRTKIKLSKMKKPFQTVLVFLS